MCPSPLWWKIGANVGAGVISTLVGIGAGAGASLLLALVTSAFSSRTSAEDTAPVVVVDSVVTFAALVVDDSIVTFVAVVVDAVVSFAAFEAFVPFLMVSSSSDALAFFFSGTVSQFFTQRIQTKMLPGSMPVVAEMAR